eukprot:TRINITY_DN4702_c0_g2_i1.p1 TRINITY_DN4702_c0_g2~~TRINITY_DN4702_c0_g2_i1.p1  ORF type:complete len:2516 (+),score=894.37 TRINITY_DN4702_c0_g2_i1:89-7636(+)
MGAGAGKDQGQQRPQAAPAGQPQAQRKGGRKSQELKQGEETVSAAKAAIKLKKKQNMALPPVPSSAYASAWRKARALLHTGHDPTFCLHFTLVSLVTPEAQAKSWNSEYQALLTRPCFSKLELISRRADLAAHVGEFTKEATEVAQTIIEELFVEDDQRTIPDIGLGTSYRHNGIMFRLWSDASQARHLHNSIGAVIGARVPGLSCPLTTTIRHRGRTMTAMACVQLPKLDGAGGPLGSRVYPLGDGSAQHGPAVDTALRRLCHALNIVASPGPPVVHIEVHAAADGCMYIFDPRRLLPALDPAQGYAGGLARRELLSQSPTPVDAAPWIQDPPARIEVVVRIQGQAASGAVDDWLKSGLSGGEELCAAMHRRGVNLRFLGLVMAELKRRGNAEAERTAAIEMVARSCRSVLHAELAESKSTRSDVGLISASRLFGAVVQDHNDFWTTVLEPVVAGKFGYPPEGLPPLKPSDVDMGYLFRRLCELTGAVVKQGSVVELQPAVKEPHEFETVTEELMILGRDRAALHHQGLLSGLAAREAYATTLLQLDRLAEAATAAGQARAEAAKLYGEASHALASTLQLSAEVADTSGDYEDAMRHALAAVAMLRKLAQMPGAGVIEQVILADALTLAARITCLPGDDEAVAETTTLTEEAEQLYQKAGLSDSVAFDRISKPLLVRATALTRNDPGPEAEGTWQAVVDARVRHYGPMHHEVGDAMTELGLVQEQQGRREEAENSLQSVLKIMVNAKGPSHKRTAVALQNLASLYFQWDDQSGKVDEGRLDLALELLAQAVVLQRAFAEQDPKEEYDLYSLLNNHANAYVKKGELSKADSLLCEALSIAEPLLGPSHPDIIRQKKNLARVRMRRRTQAAILIQKNFRAFLHKSRGAKDRQRAAEERRQRLEMEQEETAGRTTEESEEGSARSALEQAVDEARLSMLEGAEKQKAEEEIARKRALAAAQRELETAEDTGRDSADHEESSARNDCISAFESGRAAADEAEQRRKETEQEAAKQRKEAESSEESRRRRQEIEENTDRDALMRMHYATEDKLKVAKEQEEAAVKMQSAMRGHLARKDAKARRRMRDESMAAAEAALRNAETAETAERDECGQEEGRERRDIQDAKREAENAQLRGKEALAAHEAAESTTRAEVEVDESDRRAAAVSEAKESHRAADEAAAKRVQAEADSAAAQEAKRLAEERERKEAEEAAAAEEARKAEEAAALRKAEEEAAAQKAAEERAEAERKAEEEAAAQRKAEEEAAKQKAEDEAAAQKALEAAEEAARKPEEPQAVEEPVDRSAPQAVEEPVDRSAPQAVEEPADRSEPPPASQEAPAADEDAAATKVQAAMRGKLARGEADRRRAAHSAAVGERGAAEDEEAAARSSIEATEASQRQQAEVAKGSDKPQPKPTEEPPVEAAAPEPEEAAKPEAEPATEEKPEEAAKQPEAKQPEEPAKSEEPAKESAEESVGAAEPTKAQPQEEAQTEEAVAAVAVEASAEEQDQAATKVQAAMRGKMARGEADRRRGVRERATEERASVEGQEAELRQGVDASEVQERREAESSSVEQSQQIEVRAAVAAETEARLAVGQDEDAGRSATESAAAESQKAAADAAGKREAEVAAAEEAKHLAEEQAAEEARKKAEQEAAKAEEEAAAQKAAEEKAEADRKAAEDAQREADAADAAKAAEEASAEAARQESDAAVRIQSLQRGRQGRKEVERKREAKKEEAAKEEAAKEEAAKEEAAKEEAAKDAARKQESDAAVRIQSLQRGREARKQVGARRQAKKDEEEAEQRGREEKEREAAQQREKEESEAALRIQTVQRGREARKEAESRRKAKAARDAEAARVKEEEARRQASEDKRKADEEEAAKQAEAAVRIQKVQRGREARKDAEVRRKAKKETEEREAAKKAEEEAERQSEAALRIQRLQRGREGRKQADEKRRVQAAQAEAKRKAEEEEQAARKAEEEEAALRQAEAEAALRIQSVQRGREGRREADARRRDKAAARKEEEEERARREREAQRAAQKQREDRKEAQRKQADTFRKRRSIIDDDETTQRRGIRQDALSGVQRMREERAVHVHAAAIVQLQRQEAARRSQREQAESETRESILDEGIGSAEALSRIQRGRAEHAEASQREKIWKEHRKLRGAITRSEKLALLDSRVAARHGAIRRAQLRHEATSIPHKATVAGNLLQADEAADRLALMSTLAARARTAGTTISLTSAEDFRPAEVEAVEDKMREEIEQQQHKGRMGLLSRELETYCRLTGVRKSRAGYAAPTPPPGRLSPHARRRMQGRSPGRKRRDQSPEHPAVEAMTKPDSFEYTQPRPPSDDAEHIGHAPELADVLQREQELLHLQRMLLRNRRVLQRKAEQSTQKLMEPQGPLVWIPPKFGLSEKARVGLVRGNTTVVEPRVPVQRGQRSSMRQREEQWDTSFAGREEELSPMPEPPKQVPSTAAYVRAAADLKSPARTVSGTRSKDAAQVLSGVYRSRQTTKKSVIPNTFQTNRSAHFFRQRLGFS